MQENTPNKRLSILVLSPDPAVPGGVSVFAEMMKAHLANCKVTSLWNGSNPDHAENMFAMLVRVLGMPLRVMRLVRKEHFDVVHINPTLDNRSSVRDGLILLGLRLMCYRRILVYIHGWENSVADRIRRTPALRRFFLWLMQGTAHIMVLAPEFKQSLEDIGIPGGKITFTRTMYDATSLREAGDTPLPGRRTILFMSRFIREKGIYELMEAFGRIAGDFPDADLVMAGDGPENKALQEQADSLGITGRVRFPGYVSGGQKTRLLRECAIYALPTYLGEGMPIALLEAMGAGKPLLTAKAGAIQHIVSEPENGIVLDTVSAGSVEAALRRLLGDRAFCAAAGARNAAYAQERFEAGRVTAEIEALYHRIAHS